MQAEWNYLHEPDERDAPVSTNTKNRAAGAGPVHPKTLPAATDNETPTTGEIIAQLAAELDREPSLWWQGYEYGHACGYAAALETVRRHGDEAEQQAAAAELELIDLARAHAARKGPAWASLVLEDLGGAA